MDVDNPYAAPPMTAALPVAPGSVRNAWRSGRELVLGAHTELPDRCVKCNAPAAGYRKQIRLSWHSPLAFLGLLGGLLPYIIVALIMTRRVTVQVGICAGHARQRRIAMLLTAVGGFAGLGLLAVAVAAANGVFVLAALAMFLVTLVYGIVAPRVIWPKKIEAEFAWVKGVCPQYLAELPELGAPIHPITATSGGTPR